MWSLYVRWIVFLWAFPHCGPIFLSEGSQESSESACEEVMANIQGRTIGRGETLRKYRTVEREVAVPT